MHCLHYSGKKRVFSKYTFIYFILFTATINVWELPKTIIQ